MNRFLAYIATAAMLILLSEANATLIVKGDVTTNLSLNGELLFIDAAAIGGGDTSVLGAAGMFMNFTRDFVVPSGGGPGVITMHGFGFATSNVPANQTATSVKLTFKYLGQDGIQSADDVLIGSTDFGWNNGAAANGWDGNGEYYVKFDSNDRPTALIDGIANKFRIELVTTGGNVQFKTDANGVTDSNRSKLSFSGTFAAIPEPTAMLFYGGIGCVVTALRRRPQST